MWHEHADLLAEEPSRADEANARGGKVAAQQREFLAVLRADGHRLHEFHPVLDAPLDGNGRGGTAEAEQLIDGLADAELLVLFLADALADGIAVVVAAACGR